MTTASQTKFWTPVSYPDRRKFAFIDRMAGVDLIRVSRDERTQNHFTPMSWVTAFDDKIRVDCNREHATRERTTSVTASPKERSLA